MSKTGLTENILRIYEGLKKEQKLEFIIENLIHSKEKPHRSEQDDSITMAQGEKQGD